MNSKNIRTFFKTEVRFMAFLGFSIGMLFPFLSWVIEMIVEYYTPGFGGIAAMHRDFPSLFIIDLIPVFTASIFYYFTKTTEELKATLEEKIEQLNAIIKRNSELARKIGEGNLDFELEAEQQDELARALILMRDNLIATYEREAEQNWITKGKEVIGNILRESNDLETLSYEVIVNVVNYVGAVQGAFLVYEEETEILQNYATYAYSRRRYRNDKFRIGEGLLGQAAYERAIIYREDIPEDYFVISSGLIDQKPPRALLISPLIGNEKLQGVMELAFMEKVPEKTIRLIEEISGIIAQTIFNVKVNKQTQDLLYETQIKTKLLEENQKALKENAAEMEKAQKELEEVNRRLAMQIAEVERARKRLFSLLENASEVIFIYNKQGIITYVSPSSVHILGYDPDSLINRNGFEVFSPEVNAKLKQAFISLINNPSEPVTLEYLFKKEGDNEIWLETIGRNLLSNTAINGIIFNTRDITVRKIAEKAQRMSGQMRALSENSPDMIVRVNNKGKIYYANPVAEEFLGISRRYLTGNFIDRVDIHPDVKAVFRNALERIVKTHEKFELETIFPLKDSDVSRIVVFNVIPEFNEFNELETVLFVAHDITEQKQILLELEKKNKSITESINYARRIQSAIIPEMKKIRQHLPKSFMFYLPRDVVSGDIPWFYADDKYVYIAAVDCTGHGVPGALLSFIGYFLLNNIVITSPDLDAAQILDRLHNDVRRTLKQDTEEAEARDGMDIALCKIDYKNKKLNFAGAHRPMYYLRRNGEFETYKGTLKAIGGIVRKGKIEKPFINHEVDFEPEDKFFIFTDGLADQVGGPQGRKYKNKRLRDLISEHKDYEIYQFYELIKDDFMQWKGDHKQIDDVLLIGVEL